jgi:energy-coupling factor transport system substrate-specific component
MVVMISVIAAIHAAALIPFKPIVILPGVTEVRPGMVFPIVFSLLFGPAAAWGTAIGNTIGDLFGSLGPGTFFGFVGNFLYGYLPYRVWRAWRHGEPRFRSAADWLAYLLAVLAAAGACALVIGWGIHVLGLFPFVTTAGIVLVNNLLVGLLLGPPLLLAVYPRVARMHLLYEDPPEAGAAGSRGGRTLARAASLAAVVSALAGIGAGYYAAASGQPDAAITGAAAPFVLALLMAAALL